MFPPSAVRELAALSRANMPDTATLKAPARVRGAGGVTTTTYAVQAAVACRLGPLSPEERVIADREQEAADAVVILPAGTTIGHDWHVTVSGVRDDDGGAWAQDYVVVGVGAPRSYETERRVRVRALRSGSVG